MSIDTLDDGPQAAYVVTVSNSADVHHPSSGAGVEGERTGETDADFPLTSLPSQHCACLATIIVKQQPQVHSFGA